LAKADAARVRAIQVLLPDQLKMPLPALQWAQHLAAEFRFSNAAFSLVVKLESGASGGWDSYHCLPSALGADHVPWTMMTVSLIGVSAGLILD
jgi:hypothetical protein